MQPTPDHRIAYLNGSYLPLAEARVPVLDRGFLFGEGIYEVIPAYAGRPFRLDEHLQRLDTSLAGVGIAPPHTPAEWCELFDTLIARNGGGDLALYLQITRGAQEKRDHTIPQSYSPTVFAMANPIAAPAASVREQGIALASLEDIRWLRCDIKTTALLANALLRTAAGEAGADEALLVRDGLVTEGSASNVFVVRDGIVATPPKDHRTLPGITRDLVVELAATDGMALEERDITRDELDRADEIWITSSIREVVPATRLDGRPVGDGRPGPLWQRMHALFQAFKAGLGSPR